MKINTNRIESVLSEMDVLFGSRQETMWILLGRFLSVLMDGQFTQKALADASKPDDLLDLWVSYRRALRKALGYELKTVAEGVEMGLVSAVTKPTEPILKYTRPNEQSRRSLEFELSTLKFREKIRA